MAVFVYKTGKIARGTAAATAIRINIMNDDLATNTARILVWRAPSGALKTEAANTGVLPISGNNSLQVSISIDSGTAVMEFAVEVRLSNPNMVPRITATGGPISGGDLSLGAGELFFGSSATQSP